MAVLTRARAAIVAAIVAASVMVCIPAAFSQTDGGGDEPLENEVKAVFLFNFAKYVDWPAAPPGSSAAIRVCVPANPRFLAVVRDAVRDEVVHGRPITAAGLDGLDGARDCDILYVGNAATADAAAWISAARGGQTLTVGDGKLVDGLVIAFVRDQNRLRFDINRNAAASRKLSISSRLLGLARRVDP
jgi:hypothetical protein